jgi:hypothetical protein
MTKQWHGGKGSTPRSSNKQKYAENYDKIFKNNKEVKNNNESKDAKRIYNS